MPGWLVTGPHTVRGKPCHSMALGHSSGAWQMFTLCPWVGDSCPGHSVDERWYPLSVGGQSPWSLGSCVPFPPHAPPRLDL